jgi:hypothetical protein
VALIDTASGRLLRLLETGTSSAPPIAVGRTLYAASADGIVQACSPRR